MKTFSELLLYHRLRKKFTKTDLARHIKKTDAYVRKLENLQYTPPTFLVCKQLVEKLELNPKEELEFYQAAFLERIKNDTSFYKIINSKEAGVTNNYKIIEKLKSDSIKPFELCRYYLVLFIKDQTQDLFSGLQSKIEENINEVFTSMNVGTKKIKVADNQLDWIFDVPTTIALQDCVNRIKEMVLQLTSQPNLEFKNFLFTIMPEELDSKAASLKTKEIFKAV